MVRREECDVRADRIEHRHVNEYGRSAAVRRFVESALVDGWRDPDGVLDLLAPPRRGGWDSKFGAALTSQAEKLLGTYCTLDFGGDASLSWLARTRCGMRNSARSRHWRRCVIAGVVENVSAATGAVAAAQRERKRIKQQIDKPNPPISGQGS
jgi:hypothetical protein